MMPASNALASKTLRIGAALPEGWKGNGPAGYTPEPGHCSAVFPPQPSPRPPAAVRVSSHRAPGLAPGTDMRSPALCLAAVAAVVGCKKAPGPDSVTAPVTVTTAAPN